MTNFNLDDLYQMLLHRLRKDRRGSISPEEWETFLRWRNLDYFNKILKAEGADKANETALKPFFIPFERMAVTLDATTGWYSSSLTGLSETLGRWANVWFTTATWDPAELALDMTGLVEVDIVQEAELPDRLVNAITAPSATHPVGHFTYSVLYVHGIAATGNVMMSYYKLPDDPYYDYYTDENGTVTYLTEGQSAYILQAGEIARDGSVAGEVVTSASKDIEWEDEEAIDILDMIVSDVSIALSDPGSYQASLLERKEN